MSGLISLNVAGTRTKFLDQMLVELEIVKDVERVGFYSGVIVSISTMFRYDDSVLAPYQESVFSVMSLITILPTSYASDRIGEAAEAMSLEHFLIFAFP